MGSRICMNTSCGAKATVEWKKGWQLRSGQISDLCFNCGSAYENLVYCDTFHPEESGWRECSLCNKRLHCGCSASVPFIEIQDFGGVWCIRCAQSAGSQSTQNTFATRRTSSHQGGLDFVIVIEKFAATFRDRMQAVGSFHGLRGAILVALMTIHRYWLAAVFKVNDKIIKHKIQGDRIAHEAQPPTIGDIQNIWTNKLDGDTLQGRSLLSLVNIVEADEAIYLPQPQAEPVQRDVSHSMATTCIGFPALSQPPSLPLKFPKPNEKKQNMEIKDLNDSQFQSSLDISLHAASVIPNFGVALPGGLEDVEKAKPPLSQPESRPRHILPNPPKNNVKKVSKANKGLASLTRVARPPAEGRLRNQLLPRYWPRITDQELQQLSGDLNSTIVPLFEKILSASDASRIGRLVLPKACAEAYFPPVNQSDGIPLKIQDVKGNEWMFQFRFWPNNNSRMYVLEGVTPCIQSMQLQAGDTVTFSRIDPGGKLVMGFRKASDAVEAQDPLTPAPPNASASIESLYSDATDTLPAMSGYSGIPKFVKGSKDDNASALLEQLNLVNWNTGCIECKNVKVGMNENFLQQQGLGSGKKKTRNIGRKSKRLLMHSEDVLELKLTWEETQELLCPPPNVQPTIVIIDGYEIEEYNEPPVFGRRTMITTQLSGSSCSQPDETGLKELDNFFRANTDFKKRKVSESPELLGIGCSPSGLDALATAATLGEESHDHELDGPSCGATTRHPRHRPGCTCIVCIQPPSGTGKHKPTCVCNVCMTVKRRFRTLMMRKKKRQCNREAEMIQQRNHHDPSTEEESPPNDSTPNEVSAEKLASDEGGSSKGHIDLNTRPIRGDDMQAEARSCTSMISLVQAASLPLEMYMKQNGIESLIYDHEAADSGSRLLEMTGGQSQGLEEEHRVPVSGGQQSNDNDRCEEPKTLHSD